MKIIYPAIFKKFSDTEQGYSVIFPDLPGCVTEGESLEEAMEMAVDAASGWILTSMEDGEEIPAPSNYFDVKTESADEFVNYVVLNMAEYAKQNSNKSIKKTLTIPSWLNYIAEKAEVNFSQVLQKALKEQLKLTPDMQSGTSNNDSALYEYINNIYNYIPGNNLIYFPSKKDETKSDSQYTSVSIDIKALKQIKSNN